MKIVHIAPKAPYNDYWGYQENLLPKYQKKLGHDVTLIVTNTKHADGTIVETECADYILKDGVRVIRLKPVVLPIPTLTALYSRLHVFDYLAKIKPDFIFYHGLIGTTIFEVIQYKKQINPQCVIVEDNHLDYNITNLRNDLWGSFLRSCHRAINRRALPYVSKVYGVTPWRKAFAEDYFRIPPEKTDVLIMGADDEKMNLANRDSIRRDIRDRYHVGNSDFLIVTGGKIDSAKNIHVLMESVSQLHSVKLLIFGQVCTDIRAVFDALLEENDNITFIGWIDSDKVYDYFFAADLVIFPGQHSVLWEQACAAKVPCVFKRWDGMEHINNGGNSDFLDSISPDAIRQKIQELLFTEKYDRMKSVAQSDTTDIYLYSWIAKKSLECAENL